MLVSARSNFRRMNNVSMFVFPTPEDRQKFSDAIGADSVFMKPVDKNTFVTPENLFDEYRNPISITLCHYAMRSWERSHYATWHLYGHHHGKLPPYGLSFDVGVDCWNFYPVSLDQVKEKMATLKPIVDFRT